MILEAFDFAVTSCLPRGTHARRRPPPRTLQITKISNGRSTCATETASASPQLSSMDTQEAEDDSARTLVTWISHRLSTTSLCTPGDINLELAQRTTVTPRVPVFDVSAWLPRDTRPHLSIPATGGQPRVRRTLTPGQPTSTLFPK